MPNTETPKLTFSIYFVLCYVNIALLRGCVHPTLLLCEQVMGWIREQQNQLIFWGKSL